VSLYAATKKANELMAHTYSHLYGIPTTGLRFRLADNGRVVVRPSGTEPKIKCYLEVVIPVEPDEDGVDAARINAVGRLDAIRGDLQAAAGL